MEVDLSSCSNLRILRVDPEMAGLSQFSAPLQTISSKHFEKLIIGPNVDEIPACWSVNDQVVRSFAQRLYKLGVAKPLAVVIEFCPGYGTVADVQRIWPLFCEVGIIVKD